MFPETQNWLGWRGDHHSLPATNPKVRDKRGNSLFARKAQVKNNSQHIRLLHKFNIR